MIGPNDIALPPSISTTAKARDRRRAGANSPIRARIIAHVANMPPRRMNATTIHGKVSLNANVTNPSEIAPHAIEAANMGNAESLDDRETQSPKRAVPNAAPAPREEILSLIHISEP